MAGASPGILTVCYVDVEMNRVLEVLGRRILQKLEPYLQIE